MKHLKHLKHKLTKYTFSIASTCCLDEWRLVVAELDAGEEVGGSAWSLPVPQRRQRRRCPSGGTTLGKHLREKPREQRWTSTCARSNWRARRPARRAPPAAPLASGQEPTNTPCLASTPWIASTRFRDGKETVTDTMERRRRERQKRWN